MGSIPLYILNVITNGYRINARQVELKNQFSRTKLFTVTYDRIVLGKKLKTQTQISLSCNLMINFLT